MIAQPLNALYDSLSEDVAKRLSFLLADVTKGKTHDVRTPLFEADSDGEILEQFRSELFEPLATSLNGTLSEIEEKQTEKFGPRSFQKPWSDRKSSLLEGFIHKEGFLDFDNPIDLPGRGQLRPQSLDRVYSAMKRSTSAGLPFLTQKGEVLDLGLEIEPRDWPCVLFTRTQEGGKTRDVWGYPMYSLSLEGAYFLPYFEMFRTHPCLAAYSGPDAVDEAISKILFTKELRDVVISEDFESFDQSVPPEVTERIFGFIGEQFQKLPSVSDGIASISDTFINIGISTPDGVYSGPHGIPSGSWFTSILGSYVHLVAQASIVEIHDRNCQIMGDDGVILLPPDHNVDSIAEVYATFNLRLNEDKVFVSNDEVIYLQRYYSPDYKYGGLYRGIYPITRALNRLVHMERWTNVIDITGADYFAIRAISILENCKWHPMFEPFVKWIAGKDKYNLEYTNQGLKSYIETFQPRTSTTIRNQYSDDLLGIEGFETVKILKTL